MSSVAARTTSKRLPHILRAFKYKELLRLQVAQTASSFIRPEIRNPFLPSKSVSGKWRAPEYSLRRQKELIKAAKKVGLDVAKTLPIGSKTLELVGAKRLQKAVTRTAAAVAAQAEADAEKNAATAGNSSNTANAQTVHGSSSSSRSNPSSKLPPNAKGKTIRIRWSNVLPRKLASRASAVASMQPGERVLRLYGGRKKMFKGHKWERNMLKRKGQIRVRVRDMEKRIKRFRYVYERKRPRPLAPAKARKRESLPF